jgi:hypothetical protein
MRFAPTKGKAVACAITLVLWYAYLWTLSSYTECPSCIKDTGNCKDYSTYSLLRPACICNCLSIDKAMTNNVSLFLPAFVLYICISLMQKKKQSSTPTLHGLQAKPGKPK